MAAAEKKSEKQVMDVSKPGKTPADASARPIIVGHKPQVQDPMVNTAEDTNPEVSAPSEEPAATSPAASKKVIAPLSELEKPNETEATESAEPTAPTEPDAPIADTPQEEPDEQNDAPTEAGEESSDAAVVDAVAEQVGAKKKEDAESEEEKKRLAELEKLIAEKKYFVPIGKAHRKSNRITLFVTLFLFFVLVGLLAAIDAGLLDAGFDLPFDIIQN
jgi:hypothetical protein